jgi:hypothetical protein
MTIPCRARVSSTRYEALVAEVVHVLNERFHLASRSPQLEPSALFLLTPDFVACQRLAQDRHERPVAREEDAVEVIPRVEVLRGDVQPDERLTGTGHASYEADGLL